MIAQILLDALVAVATLGTVGVAVWHASRSEKRADAAERRSDAIARALQRDEIRRDAIAKAARQAGRIGATAELTQVAADLTGSIEVRVSNRSDGPIREVVASWMPTEGYAIVPNVAYQDDRLPELGRLPNIPAGETVLLRSFGYSPPPLVAGTRMAVAIGFVDDDGDTWALAPDGALTLIRTRVIDADPDAVHSHLPQR